MGQCGSAEEREEPEYDELPRALKMRLQFGKKNNNEEKNGSSVTRLGNNKLVKRGCESTEYEALRVVDRHTSVPIPKVINVYHLRDGVLVEYEAAAGKPLDQVWHGLDASKRAKIVVDLGRFVDQLRKMDPPKHVVIGSATMGAAFDPRFGTGRIGPFYTLDSFHEFIRRGHPISDFEQTEVAQSHTHEPPYKLYFTHAALCPSNVLVDEQGRIASIVGWESAGWYPEYWEYTQMASLTPESMEDWFKAIQKVVAIYETEHEADKALRQRYSPSHYERPRSVRAPSISGSELAKERQEIEDKNTDNTSG